jgi:hypothetical protein
MKKMNSNRKGSPIAERNPGTALAKRHATYVWSPSSAMDKSSKNF